MVVPTQPLTVINKPTKTILIPHKWLLSDISGNGCVDWEDFDLARQNVCRLNGWKSDMQVAIDAEETFKVKTMTLKGHLRWG